MTTTQTDRLLGVTVSLALKAPVKAATTGNITLSGEQTIDGVACVDGDRVLVKNQTNAVENGIYDVDVSSWQRSKDFDGDRDIVQGTRVFITSGTAQAGMEAQVTTESPVIGTTSIAFTLLTIIDEDISSDIETIADNIASVNTCATNISAIIDAPAAATAAAASADEAEYWAAISAGGGITSITAGDGISVDDSTPTEPIVSVDIIGQTEATVASGDAFIFADADDSNNFKKDTIQGIIDLVLSSVYPVGSYYINETVSTNPATLLGFGTWEAVTDKFIVGHGSTYTSTGGAATVTLAQNNLPATLNFTTLSGAVDNSSTSYLAGADYVSNQRTINVALGNSGGGQSFGIIPPYQAAYIWKRTA